MSSKFNHALFTEHGEDIVECLECTNCESLLTVQGLKEGVIEGDDWTERLDDCPICFVRERANPDSWVPQIKGLKELSDEQQVAS